VASESVRRVTLPLRLTPAAKRGIERYAATFGISVTTFVEAVGVWCQERVDEGFPSPLVEAEALAVIDIARGIQAQRRRRREDTPPGGVERRQKGSPRLDVEPTAGD
jgi:hypothetical protein